uniref:Uncharacterized protein n=1 Tax=Streptomyces phage Scarif TaxID=3158858 RepID=A0AAU7GWU2_9CAUD
MTNQENPNQEFLQKLNKVSDRHIEVRDHVARAMAMSHKIQKRDDKTKRQKALDLGRTLEETTKKILRKEVEKKHFPQGCVPKFYSMDPDVEDLLPSSEHLANGMVVLLADNDKRASESDIQHDWGMDRALERNRWCRVSHLFWNEPNNTFEFIAVYDDGTKRVRHCFREDAWIVKNSSVYESMLMETERYSQIYALILEGINRYGDGDKSEAAEKIARRVLGLL